MAFPRKPEYQGDSSRAQSDMYPPAKEQQLGNTLERTEIAHPREEEGQMNTLQLQYHASHATEDHRFYDPQQELQTKLKTKDQELRDLTERFRAETIVKDREMDDIRQRWKETAKELGKYQAQDKVVDQVTDSELVERARQIQYNVRNFAYQHFDSELNTGKNVQGSEQYLQKELQVSTNFFKTCISSAVKRPMLIGAILWTFLLNNIFERFCWGGGRVQHGMETLTSTLRRPLESKTLGDESEAKRKYQMWKANTSALLVDALRFDGEKEQGMNRKLKQDKIKDLCTQLAPLTKSKYEKIFTQISDIIQDALDLDQLLSKQVADIYWDADYQGRGFSEESMQLQQGEQHSVDGQKVQLVVAPGLIKRGRSTGEDYEITSVLLRITVSCELITSDSSGESHKSHLPPKESSKPGANIRRLFNTKSQEQSVVKAFAGANHEGS